MSKSLPKGMLIFLFVLMCNLGYSQLSGYDYFVDITIQSSEVSGSSAHSDFPVLIDITDPALKTVANGGDVQSSDGYDIGFTNATNSITLTHDLEDYSASDGRIRAWVKVPNLSATSNTVIRLYFGNASINSNQSSAATWSNGYVSVWHLNNNDLTDAVGSNDGTNYNTSNTTGKVADGRSFNNYYDKMKFGKFSVSGNKLTISSWFKVSDFDIDDGRIISKSNGTSNSDHYFMLSTIDNNGKRLRFRLKTNGSTKELKANLGSAISKHTWYYATAVYDGSQMKLYMNNVLVGSTSKSGNMNTNNNVWVALGNHAYYGKHFTGRIDETRIATKARSAEWISTEYSNQSNPSSFYNVGTITSTSGSGGGSAVGAFADTCSITINASQVEAHLTDFPVFLDLTSDDLKSTTYGGLVQSFLAYDIAFVDENYANALDFQIESYDEINGNLKVWVKIPSLSSSLNTKLNLLYGQSGVSANPSTSDVWDSNYKGVWHMNGNVNDATDHSNNGTNYGTSSATGKLGSGRSFDGSNDYISVPNSSSLNITWKKITLQAWVKAPIPNDEDSPFLHKANAVNQEQYMLGVDGGATNNNVNTRVTTSNSHYRHDDGQIPNQTWTHVAMVYEGDVDKKKRVYVNGVEVASHSAQGNMISTSAPLLMGKRVDGRLFEGVLDELRISSTNRSADWIKTEYNNQNNPAAFYTFDCDDSNNAGGGNTVACGQKITVVGAGAQGQSSVTLTIPNVSTVDSVRVESVFKGSEPNSVTFASSSQTLTDYNPDYAINGGTDKGAFGVVMNPTSSITITPSNNTSSVHSAVAYVYRSSPSFTETTQMEIMKVFQYRSSAQKYTQTFTIPASASSRTITCIIPVSELNNDSRDAKVTITAGGLSQTATTTTYDLGASLYIFNVQLANVPGNVTSVTVEIDSPDNSGDSFIAGNILIDVPCEQNTTPVATCANKVDVIGVGSQLQNAVTLNIPDLSTVDSIRVESIFKGTKPSSVTFASANQSITDNYSGGVVNGGSDKGFYHATLAPASSITVTPSNNTKFAYSAVAYVYRSGAYFGVTSQVDLTKVYQYSTSTPSYTKVFSIPQASSARTLKITIPITELNDDYRIAEVTITAGPIQQFVTARKENSGNSLHMMEIEIPGVPGDVSTVTVHIDSPDGNGEGDSFIAGNIVLDVSCESDNAPDVVDDYVHTAKNNPVDINVLVNDTDPNNELDRTSVNVSGLANPLNGTVSYVNPNNGMITYTPNNDFTGVDSFQYSVCNLSGACDIAWVFVHISDCGPGYIADAFEGTADAIEDYYINSSNSHNEQNMDAAIGIPDNNPALIHWGGDYIVADLTDTIAAGEYIEITWRKRADESGTAKMLLRMGVDLNDLYSSNLHSVIPTTTSFSFTTVPVLLTKNTRYVKIYKDNSYSSTDFEIDAIVYKVSKGCLSDRDGDGIPDIDDIDDDDDGILDVVESYDGNDPSADDDGDGVPNFRDSNYPNFLDLNNDGVNDNFDHDGDGTPNHLDLDSDNDGISDNIEAQTTYDYTNITMTDSDKDGLMDTYDQSEGPQNSVGIPPYDHDEDGIPDFYDDDADDDGIADWIEAFDLNRDGNPYPELTELGNRFFERSGGLDYYSMTQDLDGNGILDWMEACVSKNALPGFLDPECYCYYDTDGDGIIDLLDPDSFGDPQLQSELPNGTDDKDFRDVGGGDDVSFPIELLSFDAKLIDGNTVELKWVTVTEQNNDYFTLKKGATPNTLEWMATIEGNGNSDQINTYVRYDEKLSEGVHVYQLSQTDYDGTTMMVGEASVQVESKQNLMIVNGYTQEGVIHLNVNGVSNESATLEIYSSVGALVSVSEIETVEGRQMVALPKTEMENGIYLIRLSNATDSSTLKLFYKR